MGAGKDLDTRDRRRIRQVGLKPNDDGVFEHEWSARELQFIMPLKAD